MSPSQHSPPAASKTDDADLAQAYKDLLRGEQAATALEANLSNLESKLDALLATFEAKNPEQPEDKTKGKPADGKSPDTRASKAS
ncbi:hypothetical protein HJFPF1_03121 [Paramyrothecium foliicola]|nr:hypothetical protein HJFPF1_03121 [Paramyrothecium foliicola]